MTLGLSRPLAEVHGQLIDLLNGCNNRSSPPVLEIYVRLAPPKGIASPLGGEAK